MQFYVWDCVPLSESIGRPSSAAMNQRRNLRALLEMREVAKALDEHDAITES